MTFENERWNFQFGVVFEVTRRDRSESFSFFAGLEGKIEAHLTNFACYFLGSATFLSFASGTFGLQLVEATQVAWGYFVATFRRKKVVPGVSAFYPDKIRLGTEAGDVFSEDDLGSVAITLRLVAAIYIGVEGLVSAGIGSCQGVGMAKADGMGPGDRFPHPLNFGTQKYHQTTQLITNKPAKNTPWLKSIDQPDL